jgi:hypothetical protein
MPNNLAVQKIVASDGAVRDWFGSAVALSEDVAVIGAPDAAVSGNDAQGAAYVFNRVGGAWKQSQKLVAGDGAAFDQFGRAIALLGSKTMMITAPFATVNGNRWVGAVYVFTFNGSTWVETQKLTPSDATAFGTFGKAIAFDEKHAFVGAGGVSINNVPLPGSVYVFDFERSYTGVAWKEVQRIMAPDPADATAYFGFPIALAGNTIMVGSYAATVGGNLGQGVVYAFRRQGDTWNQIDKLIASDGRPRANFGVAVAMEGKTVFVGAPGTTVHGNVSQGAVYRFEEVDNRWVEKQELVVQEGTAINLFGASVDVSGPNVLIGAYAVNNYRGAAYIFGKPASGTGFWTLKRRLSANDSQPGDVFGYYSAINHDTALVAAWGADVGSNAAQGAAYAFRLGPPFA